MTFDTRELRNMLGLFTTGVTLIATRTDKGEIVAMTANSFSSLSLFPPLVLWSIDLKSKHFDVFDTTEHFAVNVLALSQRDMSDAYARSENDQSVFLQRFAVGEFGTHTLPGAVAVIECEVAQKTVIGDHQVIVGKVLGYQSDSFAAPLVFFGGKYRELDGKVT
jgi:flavin reductase (DIM6/NTAB) family NADH-FMN oxidoreductase RutF